MKSRILLWAAVIVSLATLLAWPEAAGGASPTRLLRTTEGGQGSWVLPMPHPPRLRSISRGRVFFGVMVVR